MHLADPRRLDWLGLAWGAYYLVVANFVGLAVYCPFYPTTFTTLGAFLCCGLAGWIMPVEKEEGEDEAVYLLLLAAC